MRSNELFTKALERSYHIHTKVPGRDPAWVKIEKFFAFRLPDSDSTPGWVLREEGYVPLKEGSYGILDQEVQFENSGECVLQDTEGQNVTFKFLGEPPITSWSSDAKQ